MKNFKSTNAIIAASVAILAIGQPALAKDRQSELNSADSPLASTLHEADALVAADKGDWTGEVALASKAYRENDSLLNEFNLATGYQNTGRSILAIPLYEDVAARGQYVPAMAIYDYRTADHSLKNRHIDSTLSQESYRRLNQIAGRPAPFNP